MDGLEGLVRQYVSKAEVLATKAQMDSDFRLTGQVGAWHAELREHARALPAGQGDTLLRRTAGALRMAAAGAGPGERGQTLQLCAARAQEGMDSNGRE